jgi:hypothetical protein
MRYYLRWWTNGNLGSPLQVADEAMAKDFVRRPYPAAHFSSWRVALHSPTAMHMRGIDHQIFAWEDGQAQANNCVPVADILRAS